MLPIIKCNLNEEDNRNILSPNCFYLPSPLLVIKKPTICYKCSQFGHISNNCSNTPKCLKCSDNHELKECKESKKHCPSCNGEHFGNDIKCQKYNEETKKINSVWLTGKNINLGVLNICSMYHKQIDLLNLMQERNISIMCLTETWLNDSINSKELIFEDYEFFRSDRESKRGGGVGPGCFTNFSDFKYIWND